MKKEEGMLETKQLSDDPAERPKMFNTQRMRYSVPEFGPRLDEKAKADAVEIPLHTVSMVVVTSASAALKTIPDPTPEPGSFASGWIEAEHGMTQMGAVIWTHITYVDGTKKSHKNTIDVIDAPVESLRLSMAVDKPLPAKEAEPESSEPTTPEASTGKSPAKPEKTEKLSKNK